MYRHRTEPRYQTPIGDLLRFLDGLSVRSLALIVLAMGTVLFLALMRPADQPKRLTSSGVPSSIFRINGGTVPQAGEVTISAQPAPAPEYANLLTSARHITSEFGHYPNGQPHYGIDLDAWYGETQYAPIGGVVTEVLRGCVEGDTTCGKGWGNHVWFKSDLDGKYVLMAHYQKIFDDIQEGIFFAAGHPLGETGSTGYSSGPHVHIQVNPEGMQNTGSENPAWEFPWLRCGEPSLGNLFGSACN